MGSIDIIQWAAELLLPVATGVAGYLSGRRKKNNDFLGELQETVNMLTQKNHELMQTVVELRDTIITLRAENAELKSDVAALRKENLKLSSEVAQLREQLRGVRTITRTRPAETPAGGQTQ